MDKELTSVSTTPLPQAFPQRADGRYRHYRRHRLWLLHLVRNIYPGECGDVFSHSRHHPLTYQSHTQAVLPELVSERYAHCFGERRRDRAGLGGRYRKDPAYLSRTC